MRPFCTGFLQRESPVREQPGLTRPLAAKNVQLVTEGEVLQFQNRPAAESAGKNRDDGTHELKHTGANSPTMRSTVNSALPAAFACARLRRSIRRPGPPES